MRSHLVLLPLVAACAIDPDVVSSVESELTSYSYRRVDYPGAVSTLVLGNNDFGHYVGLFVDPITSKPHAMRFDGHDLAPIDPAGVVGTSPRSRAYATNNLGHVVGSYNDAAGNLHGYLLCGGTITTIDVPDGSPTEVYGINDVGHMIGVSYDADGTTHGFSLVWGQFRDLDVPGAASTIPLSINDRGRIVGEVVEAPDTIGHGFIRARGGAITTYDAPAAPPDSTYLISINNRNHLLGAYFDESFTAFNFVLRDGVETAFELPADFAATGVTAQTLNDRGDIVGYYADAAGRHGFIAER